METFPASRYLIPVIYFPGTGRFAMRWKAVLPLSAVFLGLLILSPARIASLASVAMAPQSSTAQPVVLELFTSEGCSSCPPADAFLKRLDDAGRVGDVEVIAIEEHVDYWDHLGWRDPFSSPEWTTRQEQYAKAFGRNGIYTPQLVVNGRNELVGSSEREALRSISSTAKLSDAAIRISAINLSSKSAELAITIEAPPSNLRSEDLWLAVTERGLSSSVLRGENEGRNLTHAAVLRSLTRVRIQDTGPSRTAEAKTSVPLERIWKRENLRIVVFLQEPKTLHISGAAASQLPASEIR
jgi:hypothetical protein